MQAKRLLALGALLVLAGCTTGSPPVYMATIDNIRALQTLPRGKVALGPFTTKSDSLNHMTIRASTFEAPDKTSFGEYLRSALQAELMGDGRFDANSAVVITGELLANSIDSSVGTGTAHVSARITIARAGATIYDKVLDGDAQWESSFVGAVAIPLARQEYADAVKKLIGKLFADPDFRKAF